jgi:hypothetical protein
MVVVVLPFVTAMRFALTYTMDTTKWYPMPSFIRDE